MGIEPTLFAWEAKVLPLNYTRMGVDSSGANLLTLQQNLWIDDAKRQNYIEWINTSSQQEVSNDYNSQE